MSDERKANDYQIGGKHYKTGYEHWDLCLTIPYSYLEGYATKYVTRARKKNGIEDLKKALHCVNKLQEDGNYQARSLTIAETFEEISRFAAENDLTEYERHFCEIMGMWGSKGELDEARQMIFLMLDEAEKITPGTPVPLTEENKHALSEEPDAS